MAANPSKRDRWPDYKPVRFVLIRRRMRWERPYQGLLVEWRRHSYRWFALVAFVDDDGAMVMRWLPADTLLPIEVDPNVLDKPRLGPVRVR
ncbi:hypothetical protein [Nocardioides speluncae]|uniref:hypothetical protein n=1 Tax=Nocardioides speluncae TaxID=2670337 RepID=UPI000D69A2CD|nr:hypothetical protein [Nocardioides speluncae]